VVSHDRALLRPHGSDRRAHLAWRAVYGGGYDLYAERKAAEEAAAAHALADAERQAVRVAGRSRSPPSARPAATRRGRRSRVGSSDPKILLDARKEQAEASAGRGARQAERLMADAAAARAEAEARVERVRRWRSIFPRPGSRRQDGAGDGGRRVRPSGRPAAASRRFAADHRPERVAVTARTGSARRPLSGSPPARSSLPPAAWRATARSHSSTSRRRCCARRDAGGGLPSAEPNGLGEHRAGRPGAVPVPQRGRGQQVSALSGGERLRAGLASVLMAERPPQLLILDEPTNHLDLDSIAAIEAALSGYDGALLVVSHDRDFLAAIGIEREVALGQAKHVRP
jgi:ATPase subunit of ABC transporter with duplicated ATPase domains